MKTITIYELLGLVKDGKAPKKIRFDNTNWNKRCGRKNTYYISDDDRDLFIYFFRKNLTFTLNDKVEILEEKKKIPEKINKSYDIRILDLDKPHSIKDYDMEQLIEMVQDIYEKQGEICDYLKSKGE